MKTMGGTGMRRIVPIAVGLALAGAVATGVVVARRGGGTPAPSEPGPPVPVVTTQVRQGDVPIVLRGLGTVAAYNVATIRSQVQGYLDSVDFIEGRAVKKGDVLARIDPSIFQARLDQAKGKLAADQAQVGNVQTNLGRSEPLLKQGYATDIQVTGQKAKVSELQSDVQSTRAAVAYAQAEFDFATLRAPFAGVTGFRLIDIGNLVRPSDPGGIVVLTQVQPISVVFTIPSVDIPAVQAALARGPVAADVFDQTGRHRLDTGTLLLVDNQAQVRSGTVQLKADFPNARRQLWPGTFVTGEVTTSVVKDALSVPTNALQQNDKGQYVYVVDAQKRASIRPVEVSQRRKATALIAKGLSAGETVVVQGQYRLVPGSTVVETRPDEVADTTAASVGLLP